MKQRTRLISLGATCQLCKRSQAEVLFRNHVWCLLDVLAEGRALRGSLPTRAGGKAR